MTDDGRSEMDLPLAAPVGDPSLRPPRRPYTFFRDPLIWSACGMLAVASAVGSWVVLHGDRAGGQPMARLAVTLDTQTRAEDIGLPIDHDAAALNGAWTDAALNLPSPGRDRVLSLSSLIDPAVAEESVYGILPRIAEDGRRPMDVYARPTVRFAGRTRARVAVVLTGLGLSEKGTRATIEAMPGGVTLGFVPYAARVAEWAAEARQSGHETLLQLPQEPYGYPDNDPGPRAVLTHLPAGENVERLRWSLAQMHSYVGIVPFMGERFALDDDALSPVLEEIGARGLLYVDDATNKGSKVGPVSGRHGVALAAADVRLTPGTPGEIDAQLAALEDAADANGRAVAIAQAHPDIVARISAWAPTLEDRGILLAPISSIATRSSAL